ncbi:hypothetical protein EYF80_025049 [Liparis tanakae]|uniref:Uncharacterized protein n=1 Tax=Liparis tanakae TaxID=230148 RepID=A0A4Z2HIH4_9TELE|nr:hypothetical protein EYF80_025049 [Liparis tanakae]
MSRQSSFTSCELSWSLLRTRFQTHAAEGSRPTWPRCKALYSKRAAQSDTRRVGSRTAKSQGESGRATGERAVCTQRPHLWFQPPPRHIERVGQLPKRTTATILNINTGPSCLQAYSSRLFLQSEYSASWGHLVRKDTKPGGLCISEGIKISSFPAGTPLDRPHSGLASSSAVNTQEGDVGSRAPS